VRDVVVYDLLGDALREFDRQFVLIDCCHGAVAEHRVRDVIANRVLARVGQGGNSVDRGLRLRGFPGRSRLESGSARVAGLRWFLRIGDGHARDMGTNTVLCKF